MKSHLAETVEMMTMLDICGKVTAIVATAKVTTEMKKKMTCVHLRPNVPNKYPPTTLEGTSIMERRKKLKNWSPDMLGVFRVIES